MPICGAKKSKSRQHFGCVDVYNTAVINFYDATLVSNVADSIIETAEDLCPLQYRFDSRLNP